MGPAHGRAPRDARRRSRCGSLQRSPWVAFRPPPLTPAPPAERLRSMASGSRHRSAVVAGRGLSRRVAERRRATLPMGRVSSASAQPALTRPGSRCPWQVARSVRARYGFRCTESSCRLRRGRTAPKSLSPKGAGTPVASRPKRSVPSPVLVLERLALKLPERPHRRRYPAQRKADDEAG